MSQEQSFLAVDLGASSGRVVAGFWDGSGMRLQEMARFENNPVRFLDSLHWNILQLWTDVQKGLRAARQSIGSGVRSVGVDTWGVDYALVGPRDELLGIPYHYRDSRTDGMMDEVFAIVPKEEIYRRTGVQFLFFNTLYQLAAQAKWQPKLQETAERVLLMPDLFHWFLSGEKSNETTNATTTQVFDTQAGKWSHALLADLDIPTRLFAPTIPAGTRLGKILPAVAEETGLEGVDVVAPATHDTASAVLAVPAQGTPGERPNWCYISSGTWSLMGVEVPAPIITAESLAAGFTNEGGVFGTTRFLKNITGLWVLQECRRAWAREGNDHSWEDLALRSGSAPVGQSFIDPDHHSFQAPGDMPAAVRNFCRRTNQPVPQSVGEVVRCCQESLAMKYRFVLEQIEGLMGGPIEVVHMVGGGVQNKDLCQTAANVCGKPVLAGPVEATALGNCLMQAVAAGAVKDVAQARVVVRKSYPPVVYEPQRGFDWNAAYSRFRAAAAKGSER